MSLADPGFLLPAAPVPSVEAYLAGGGGRGIACAHDLGPRRTREEIRRSGLRGRGGAGFPAGRKWESVASQTAERRFVVCNGAEGEPGTFKDRALMRANPYQLVEGLLIAAFAVSAEAAYVCLKERFEPEREAVTRAVAELQRAGIGTHCAVTIVAGPSEYLYGEEKALLAVIEGGGPLPRWFPPYEHGLFARAPATGWEGAPVPLEAGDGPTGESNPTVVNNVETLSNVPHILARGADWFRGLGTEASPGTVVATVVGDVSAPGVAEVELGTPIAEVIRRASGGVGAGRRVKAVLSGVANPVLAGEHLDTPMSYEGFEARGSGMGAAGLIVLDDTACMIQAALNCSRFLYVESCGQCPPCKTGSGEITDRLQRIESGIGTPDDVAEISWWLDRVTDGNRCYLAVQEQVVVASTLRAFPDELDEHLREGRCPRPRPLPMWSLLDLRDGVATYDESFWRKQPDWTYLPEPRRVAPRLS